jgi:hypothetical protein
LWERRLIPPAPFPAGEGGARGERLPAMDGEVPGKIDGVARRRMPALRRWRVVGVVAAILLVLAAIGEWRLREYELRGYDRRWLAVSQWGFGTKSGKLGPAQAIGHAICSGGCWPIMRRRRETMMLFGVLGLRRATWETP